MIYYKIIEKNNTLFAQSIKDNSTFAIHQIHCCENLEDLKQDVANIYLVAEEFTNSPFIHLITAFSEDEALQQIDEYLRENNDEYQNHLIGVFKCSL